MVEVSGQVSNQDGPVVKHFAFRVFGQLHFEKRIAKPMLPESFGYQMCLTTASHRHTYIGSLGWLAWRCDCLEVVNSFNFNIGVYFLQQEGFELRCGTKLSAGEVHGQIGED